MSTEEGCFLLRVKVQAEDGPAVMEMTGPAVPDNGLQAIGDWVLAALEQHADGAAEVAQRMIAALRERTGRATTSWRISLTRCRGPARCRICAPCQWIWTSWPGVSSKATRCTGAVA